MTAEHWLGTVDTDSDGAPDGSLVYHQVPGSRHARGSTVHFGGDYDIETGLYSFTARLSIMLNTSNGSIRGNGVITRGWLDGTRVHLEAGVMPSGSEGVIRLMPGSADY